MAGPRRLHLGFCALCAAFVGLAFYTHTRTGGGSARAAKPPRGSSKRGAGVTGGNWSDAAALRSAWGYDWTLGDGATAAKALGVEFVPLAWGHEAVEELEREADPAPVASVLGFNEPDNAEEANLTPERAADLWPALVRQARRRGARLGSPAVMSRPGHEAWQRRFLRLLRVRGLPPPDFLAVHFYEACDARELEKYVLNWHRESGLPLWLTEFSCIVAPLSEQLAFMNTALPMLDALPESVLERYAWFATRVRGVGGRWPDSWYEHCGLVDAETQHLTPLGQRYSQPS